MFSPESMLAFASLLCSLLLAFASHKVTALPPKRWISPASKLSPLNDMNVHHVSCDLQAGEATNCIFDEMLNGWVPLACYNEQLASNALRNDTYLAAVGGAGHYPWYQDHNFTTPISSTELAQYLQTERGNMTAHTWEKWHVAHCLYIWRQGFDIMTRVTNGEKNIYVDNRVLDADHINHCNNVIANQDHRMGAKATVYFSGHKCVRVA